jgi:hypothetical protein
MLLSNNSSEQLVNLLTDILNKGLRLHLTEYHAKFRKWYNNELADNQNINLTPQEIQSKFPEFINLTTSMLEVNTLLIEYARQLQQIIKKPLN